MSLSAQRETSIGMNIPPWFLNGLELQAERQVLPYLNLQAGAGFRLQSRSPENLAENRFLDRYIQRRNRAAFFSLGARLFEPLPNEHPYISFQLTAIRYSDTYLDTDMDFIQDNGLALGFSVNFGYYFPLGKRLSLDLGMRLGYAPPRSQMDFYYYPGLGFTTEGLDVIGYRGGHIQPLVVLNYKIIRDPRHRILEQD